MLGRLCLRNHVCLRDGMRALDKSLARSSTPTLLIQVKAKEWGFSSLKWQFTHHLFVGMLVTSEP